MSKIYREALLRLARYARSLRTANELTPLRGVRNCSRRFAALAFPHSLADQITVKLRGSLRIFFVKIVGRDEYRPNDQYLHAVEALCRFGFKISS